MSSPARGRLRFGLLATLAVAAAAAWLARTPLLVAAAELLVSEDGLAPADVMVVSYASAKTGALEAAQLFRQGIAPRVVIARWVADPVDETIRRLGVSLPTPTEVITAVLEHDGVPAKAVELLPERVEGTESEVAAVAAFARARRPATLLFITARSHTRRAAWLLRRSLPPTVRLVVRSPHADPFDPGGWWQRRDQSREVVTEYVRWVSTLVPGDGWDRAGAGDPAMALSRER